MLNIRKSQDRGYADHGWLKSRHTFSFADYYDPAFMGFKSLRVINEDRIDGGTGFGKHPHRDMEIISYVLDGALEHEDSMGNKAVIRPGEVQRMSAGSGVVHAEYNKETGKPTHFFQIWILPESRGGQPGYGQKSFEAELAKNEPVLVVSRDGRDGSIAIKQDADLYIARMKPEQKIEHELRAGRGAWVQVVRGEVTVGGQKLKTGDAVSIAAEERVTVLASEPSEILLFDLV